jgi:hypothetical protein
MRAQIPLLVSTLAVTLAFTSIAQAKTLTYTSGLDGKVETSATGSAATGKAVLKVDTDSQIVDLDLDVAGIPLDGLFSNLVKQPLGPIHLHIYSGHDHAHADVTLLLPVPYGPTYAPAAGGFTVRVKGYPYATGAAVLKSTISFDQFVAALDSGDVVLNIHTDKFHDGEISGVMVRKG